MATLYTVEVQLAGDAPLLMHNERGVNTFDPLVQEKARITSKGKKQTDDERHRVERLEWEISLYFSTHPDPHGQPIGPYIPGENLKKCWMESAAAFRGGMAVKRGVTALDHQIPLQYTGPRDIEGLWADTARFVDLRSARVQRSKVMRCRPIFFPPWHLTAQFYVLSSVLDLNDFATYIKQAGSITGLGDYRPRFGRFTATMQVLSTMDIADATDLESDDEDTEEHLTHAAR